MRVTKLMEWLLGGVLYVVVWLALLLEATPVELTAFGWHVVTYLPVYTVLIFGVVSLAVLVFRVANFRDCPEAAAELRAEIEEARVSLKRKGLQVQPAGDT